MVEATLKAYDACRAYVEGSNTVGLGAVGRRKCVLLSGHYVAEDEGAGAQSWHTDCPEAIGKQYPTDERHQHEHGGSCSIWADRAKGAHPDTRIAPGSRGSETPALSDTIKAVQSAANVIPTYTANVQLGTTGLTVHGPARFVATVVRAFADAFEEESER